MKCERVRIYSWTGNEVWECKGHALPPPSGERWVSPNHYAKRGKARILWPDEHWWFSPLDPTAES